MGESYSPSSWRKTEPLRRPPPWEQMQADRHAAQAGFGGRTRSISPNERPQPQFATAGPLQPSEINSISPGSYKQTAKRVNKEEKQRRQEKLRRRADKNIADDAPFAQKALHCIVEESTLSCSSPRNSPQHQHCPALNAVGLAAVVARGRLSEVEAFINRMVHSAGAEIVDMWKLSDCAEKFSQLTKAQNYQATSDESARVDALAKVQLIYEEMLAGIRTDASIRGGWVVPQRVPSLRDQSSPAELDVQQSPPVISTFAASPAELEALEVLSWLTPLSPMNLQGPF